MRLFGCNSLSTSPGHLWAKETSDHPPHTQDTRVGQSKDNHGTHYCLKRRDIRDFPGGPLVKTLHFQCRRGSFDPWSGNEDPTLSLGKSFWRVVVSYWYIAFRPHGSRVAKPLHLCTVPSVPSKQMTKAVILAGAACMLSLTTVSSPLKTPVIFFSYISHNFFLPVELSVGYILNCHNIPV